MSRTLPLTVILLQTVFIGLGSAFVVHIAHTHFNTLRGWTFCGLTLLTVWLFLAYCWQQTLLEEAPRTFAVMQEQPEGVWPPAPVLPEGHNED